jgi:hypothetical protein
VLLFGLLTALFSSWGSFGNLNIANFNNVPLHLVGRDAPKSMFFFLFFALAIPCFAIALAGFSLISRKNLFNSVIAQTMGGLWLMGLFGFGMTAGKYADNYRRSGSFEKTINLQMANSTPTFAISDNENWENYNEVEYYIEANTNENIEVVQKFEANGTDEEQAKVNAQAIKHKINQTDSIFTFDRVFELDSKAKYRIQELDETLKLPKGKVFYITRVFAAHIHNFDLNWDNIDWEIKENRVKGNDAARFRFNQNGNLETLDKNAKNTNRDEDGRFIKEFSLNNFNSLTFTGNLIVEIEEGTSTKVTAIYENEDILEYLKVSQTGDNLMAEFAKENETMTIKIQMPNIANLKLQDQVTVKIGDFNLSKINIELFNSSHLEIEGKTNLMNLVMRDQSRFDGFDFEAEEAQITSSNQSVCNVSVTKKLKAEAIDQSNITYNGDPRNLQMNPNGQATIAKKDDE